MLSLYLQAMPSITSKPVCNANEADLGWMHDIVEYLQMAKLPEEEKQAHKLRVQVAFTLINDQLYRWSFGGSYLRCLSNPKAKYVLAKLYEGVCDNHLGKQTLAHRIHAQGYYWPTMKQDAEIYVKRCD